MVWLSMCGLCGTMGCSMALYDVGFDVVYDVISDMVGLVICMVYLGMIWCCVDVYDEEWCCQMWCGVGEVGVMRDVV